MAIFTYAIRIYCIPKAGYLYVASYVANYSRKKLSGFMVVAKTAEETNYVVS